MSLGTWFKPNSSWLTHATIYGNLPSWRRKTLIYTGKHIFVWNFANIANSSRFCKSSIFTQMFVQFFERRLTWLSAIKIMFEIQLGSLSSVVVTLYFITHLCSTSQYHAFCDPKASWQCFFTLFFNKFIEINPFVHFIP